MLVTNRGLPSGVALVHALLLSGRVGRPLRVIQEGQIWFITSRCFQCRYLFRPDPEVRALCEGWLARAVARFGVELYAAMFMSNHFHLCARFPARNMAEFMAYFKSQLAQALNRHWNRTGAVFHRRYSAEPILDDRAALDRWLYTMANPVQAGLVTRGAEWPGFSTLTLSLAGGVHRCALVDRRRYHAALQKLRPGETLSPEQFATSYELKISRLPGLEQLDDLAYQDYLRSLVAQREAEIAAERRARGLGAPKADLACRHVDRPSRPKQSPRPLCHGSTENLVKAYIQAYSATVTAYLHASKAYRSGVRTTEFPAGTYPPPIIRAGSDPGSTGHACIRGHSAASATMSAHGAEVSLCRDAPGSSSGDLTTGPACPTPGPPEPRGFPRRRAT